MAVIKYQEEEIISNGLSDQANVYLDFCWKVIDVCNYKCSYCSAGYGHKSTRPVSNFRDPNVSSAWKNVIQRLKFKRLSPFILDLLGGEPTLHPNITDIIESVIDINKCFKVILTTNLSRPVEFYLNLPDSDKLIINASIHFEYYDEMLVDKLIEINKHKSIHALIMIHDDIKYKSKMTEFIKRISDHDISYGFTHLFPTSTYTPDYSTNHYNEMKDILIKSNDKSQVTGGRNMYEFSTARSKLMLTQKQVIDAELNRFEGWDCSAKSWDISTSGEFLNSCTREPLDVLYRNINTTVKCPVECCQCTAFWHYDKHK